jgi:glutamyl-tRNA(Gln) amidotransferase subunit E
VKVGLEIHQQLATGKLFCSCGGDLTENLKGEFVRSLQATGGETGATDQAAKTQAAKGMEYRYQVTPNTCLVEADEEPPYPLNQDALKVVLTISEMLGAHVSNEIVVMRKMVVDGSNTCGFQRTALVAVDGKLVAGGKTHVISTVCIEEDAARKITEKDGEITYRLDRLGIPLIEIASAPDISSGAEAKDVAEGIGMLLRSTHRVKRGLGTIREDLNVSIPEGARVEIKGVQELGAIESYVENEAQRQKVLADVSLKLKGRHPPMPPVEPVDLTAIMSSVHSKVVAGGLQHGGVAFGLPLPGFGGLLGQGDKNPERLGRELADYARSAGVRGILHSDELPGYGITAEEVDAIRKALGLKSLEDGFVLVVASPPETARRALNAVRGRAVQAFSGVPEETRDPLPDGRSRYSRPLPGRHRMYPETDLTPYPVPGDLLKTIRSNLPEPPQATLQRLSSKGLSADVARTLLKEGDVDVFDAVTKDGLSASIVARVLTQEIPALEKDLGHPLFEDPEKIAPVMRAILSAVEKGVFAKEGIGAVLKRVLVNGEDLNTAIERSGLHQMSRDDLVSLVNQVLDQNVDLIKKKGMGAMSPLMGDVMAKVRGRRDGQEVAEVVRSLLGKRFESNNKVNV